jgi:hypothetical protein
VRQDTDINISGFANCNSPPSFYPSFAPPLTLILLFDKFRVWKKSCGFADWIPTIRQDIYAKNVCKSILRSLAPKFNVMVSMVIRSDLSESSSWLPNSVKIIICATNLLGGNESPNHLEIPDRRRL